MERKAEARGLMGGKGWKGSTVWTIQTSNKIAFVKRIFWELEGQLPQVHALSGCTPAHFRDPLFALRHLRHLHPLIFHFPHPHLCLQSPSHFLMPLLLLLHPLALSASEGQYLSGCLSNGQSHIAISRSGSPLQPFPFQMMKMTTQMTPLTSSMRILLLLCSAVA